MHSEEIRLSGFEKDKKNKKINKKERDRERETPLMKGQKCLDKTEGYLWGIAWLVTMPFNTFIKDGERRGE